MRWSAERRMLPCPNSGAYPSSNAIVVTLIAGRADTAAAAAARRTTTGSATAAGGVWRTMYALLSARQSNSIAGASGGRTAMIMMLINDGRNCYSRPGRGRGRDRDGESLIIIALPLFWRW